MQCSVDTALKILDVDRMRFFLLLSITLNVSCNLKSEINSSSKSHSCKSYYLKEPAVWYEINEQTAKGLAPSLHFCGFVATRWCRPTSSVWIFVLNVSWLCPVRQGQMPGTYKPTCVNFSLLLCVSLPPQNSVALTPWHLLSPTTP